MGAVAPTTAGGERMDVPRLLSGEEGVADGVSTMDVLMDACWGLLAEIRQLRPADGPLRAFEESCRAAGGGRGE